MKKMGWGGPIFLGRMEKERRRDFSLSLRAANRDHSSSFFRFA